MLDPFAQLFQHCWGHVRSLRIDYKLRDTGVVFFPRCSAGPKLFGSCYTRLHTTANTRQTTPNIVGATMLGVAYAHYALITSLGTQGLYSSHDAVQVPNFLGVVTPVCTPLPTRAKQLPTLLAQQCWELLHPFARSLIHLTKMITIRGRLTFKKRLFYPDLYFGSRKNYFARNCV